MTAFTSFRDGLRDDPDLGRDVRMMVPVFHDTGRDMTKVWAFLGWAADPLTVSFAQRPLFQVLDERGRPDPKKFDVIFADERHQLMFPVTAEIYGPPPRSAMARPSRRSAWSPS